MTGADRAKAVEERIDALLVGAMDPTTVRHLSPTVGLSYMLVVTIGAFFGYVVSAYLSDAIGRRRNFIIFSVCSPVVVLVYTTSLLPTW